MHGTQRSYTTAIYCSYLLNILNKIIEIYTQHRPNFVCKKLSAIRRKKKFQIEPSVIRNLLTISVSQLVYATPASDAYKIYRIQRYENATETYLAQVQGVFLVGSTKSSNFSAVSPQETSAGCKMFSKYCYTKHRTESKLSTCYIYNFAAVRNIINDI